MLVRFLELEMAKHGEAIPCLATVKVGMAPNLNRYPKLLLQKR
jgi:hypothetical protein